MTTSERTCVTCVTCVHWRFNAGTRSYSRETPGESWSSRCEKNRWEEFAVYEECRDFRETLLTAESCPDYQLVELKR